MEMIEITTFMLPRAIIASNSHKQFSSIIRNICAKISKIKEIL